MQYNIRNFTKLNSTQTALIEADKMENLTEWSVFVAKSQKDGKGQAANVWESEDGKNLTFSLLLKPLFIKPSEQFSLTQILSLGVLDFLKLYVDADFVKIKWSNDIYIRKNKICGILIQNTIIGNEFHKAYCGIGLNVNQTAFTHAPNPTSLALETTKTYDLQPLLNNLLDCISARYEAFRIKPDMNAEYLAHLLYMNELRTYFYKGKKIEAKIIGINDYGSLRLEQANGKVIEAEQKEVVFSH
jgi:BirA family biotin operon repressor/biotin-[acetyl-CoA-carboxylase] ligase